MELKDCKCLADVYNARPAMEDAKAEWLFNAITVAYTLGAASKTLPVFDEAKPEAVYRDQNWKPLEGTQYLRNDAGQLRDERRGEPRGDVARGLPERRKWKVGDRICTQPPVIEEREVAD